MEKSQENLHKELDEIRFILKDFLKVIKVVSMYPANNPLPQSLRQSFSEKLERIAQEYGPIDIVVDKDSLLCRDQVVYKDRSKEECLAGMFFNTGITRFTFKETLSVDEIFKLLEVIKNFLNAPKNSCDLAGLIWESGISDFRFATVEDVALSGYDGKIESDLLGPAMSRNSGIHASSGAEDETSYGALFDQTREIFPGELDGPGDLGVPEENGQVEQDSGKMPSGSSVFFSHVYRDLDNESSGTMLESEDKLNTVAAARAMGFADIVPAKTVPNTTLILNDEFKLSEEEEKEFKVMLEEDGMFDLFESTVEILKEVLHQETNFAGFTESVTICEKVQSDLVRSGALEHAAELLGFIRQLEDRIRSSMPQWADRLKEATITAGSRERLQILAEALNDQPEINQDKISIYLRNLGWESLAGVTDLLGDVEHRMHRDAICNYLSDEGKNKVDLISRGVFDKRWFVVRNATAILARIGDDKALGYLYKIVNHEEKRVRLALVENLKDCTNIKALEILSKLVMDRDAEVREKAVRTLIVYKGPGAFELILEIAHSEKFVTFEDDHKKIILEAYSILGGESAVDFLTRLIVRFNLFRNSPRESLRRAAVEALVHNNSEKAEKILLTLASSWRMNIRSLATAALQKKRAVTYGSDNTNND